MVLLLTAPLWVVAAIAVKFTSPGPVLYAGMRAGRYGEPFRMYKFRSMSAGSDGPGPSITAGDDPRITPVGRWLRKTKLDELPQLINVLQGDMSLVGPRPEALDFVALYDDRQRQVLSVRPGITGPTQILYRNEEHLLQHANVEDHYRMHIMPVKLESDLAYVHSHTLPGDILLLTRTAAKLFSR